MKPVNIIAILVASFVLSGCGPTLYYNLKYSTELQAQQAFIQDQMRCRGYANGSLPMSPSYNPSPSSYVVNGDAYTYGNQTTITGTIRPQYSYSDAALGTMSSVVQWTTVIARESLYDTCMEQLGWTTTPPSPQEYTEYAKKMQAKQQPQQQKLQKMSQGKPDSLDGENNKNSDIFDCQCERVFRHFAKTAPEWSVLQNKPWKSIDYMVAAYVHFIFKDRVSKSGGNACEIPVDPAVQSDLTKKCQQRVEELSSMPYHVELRKNNADFVKMFEAELPELYGKEKAREILQEVPNPSEFLQ